MSLATVLGYASGVALVAPTLDSSALLGTALTVQTCHAIMCRLFAHNNGYPKNLWTVLGLIAGLWAVAVLILLPRRKVASPPPRPLP